MAAQISPVAVLAPVAPSAPAGVAATSSATAATNPGAQAFSSELTQAYRPPEKSSANPSTERAKVAQVNDQQGDQSKAAVAEEGKELPTGGEGLPRQVSSEETQQASGAETQEADLSQEPQAVDNQTAVAQQQETVVPIAQDASQATAQSEQLQRQQALLAISQAASETIADSANLPPAAAPQIVAPVVDPLSVTATEPAPVSVAVTAADPAMVAVDTTTVGLAPQAQSQPLQSAPLVETPVPVTTHAVSETLDTIAQKQAQEGAVAQQSVQSPSPLVAQSVPTSQEQPVITAQTTTSETVAVASTAAASPTTTQAVEVSTAVVDGEPLSPVAKPAPIQEQPVAVAEKASLVQAATPADALASAVSKAQLKTTESPAAIVSPNGFANSDTADAAQLRQATLQSFTSQVQTPTAPAETAIQPQQPAAAIPGSMAQPLAAGSLLSEQIAAQVGERATSAASAEAESTSTRVITNSVESLAQAAQMQSSLRSQAPAQLQMPKGLQPGMAGFNQAVAEKVVIAAGQNLRVANIQLDPPELGALQIRLQVGADQQVSVSFTSPHGNVRDAVEQSIPRLREMLEEQGLSLGESSVNDQSGQGSGDAQEGSDAGQGQYLASEGEPLPEQTAQGSVSLVDYYA